MTTALWTLSWTRRAPSRICVRMYPQLLAVYFMRCPVFAFLTSPTALTSYPG